jgi:hypothetical protein
LKQEIRHLGKQPQGAMTASRPWLALSLMSAIGLVLAQENGETAGLYVWTAELDCPGAASKFTGVKIGKVATVPWGLSSLKAAKPANGAPLNDPYYFDALRLAVMARVASIAINVAESTGCTLGSVQIQRMWFYPELAELRRRSAATVTAAVGAAAHINKHNMLTSSPVDSKVQRSACHRVGDSFVELAESLAHAEAERVSHAVADPKGPIRLWRAIHSGLAPFHSDGLSGKTEWFFLFDSQGNHLAGPAQLVDLAVQAVQAAHQSPVFATRSQSSSMIGVNAKPPPGVQVSHDILELAAIAQLLPRNKAGHQGTITPTHCGALEHYACVNRIVGRWMYAAGLDH